VALVRRAHAKKPTPLSKSEQMARVRSKDTDAELLLRRALWSHGLRYRVTSRRLPGTPDITFGPAKVAVFVDGCFWHGCPEHYTKPRANDTFWQEKLRRNRTRDERVDSELAALGWVSVRIWEHAVYNDVDGVIARVKELVERRAQFKEARARAHDGGTPKS
jgi:DNA mismatch endonuclease, patch repair protein